MDKSEVAMHLTLKALEMDMVPRLRLDANHTQEQMDKNIALNASLVATFYKELIARLSQG